MNRAQMMASTSTLTPRVAEPKHFTDPYWRGIMFGWDEARPREFDGLKPRYNLAGRGHGIPPPGWCDGEVIETWPNGITVRFDGPLPDDLTECRFHFEPRMMVQGTRPGGYIRSIDFTGGQEIAEW